MVRERGGKRPVCKRHIQTSGADGEDDFEAAVEAGGGMGNPFGPYSETTSSGFTTLPRDLDIFWPSSPRISPWLTSF